MVWYSTLSRQAIKVLPGLKVKIHEFRFALDISGNIGLINDLAIVTLLRKISIS